MPANNSSFIGNIPENYDRYLGPFLFEPFARDIVERIHNTEARNILEIACGTGRVTRHIRKAFPYSVKLTATDLNADMLKIAKKNIEDNSVEFKVVDAQDLPFADDTFDVIVCQFGYMFVPDKSKAFSDAYRVLKKGGYLIFNTWDRIENNPLTHSVNKIIIDFFGDSPPQFYQVPYSMYNKDELFQFMQAAQFTNISINRVKKEAISHSALEVVKGFITGTAIYNEIIQKNAAAPELLIAKAEKEIVKTYGIYAKSNLSAWIIKAFKEK
jgi:ubiquinone/menaquinone biosynthesis C-methylase UbiE